MKISKQDRQKTVDYMTTEIKHIITQFGDRDAGSQGELKALDYMQSQLNKYSDNVKSERFSVHPQSFYGWTNIVSIFFILSTLLYLVSPLISIALIVVGILPMIFQFVLYMPLLDKLYPKKTSGNVWGSIKPQGPTTRRIVLNGHSDAAWEWHWHHKGGYKMFILSIVLPILSGVMILGISILSLVKGRLFLLITPTTAPLEFYLWISSLIFVPSLIGFNLFSNNKVVVPGANDNLTACEMAIGTLKAMKDNNIRMQNTEVVALITGSEEAGLRGAKFFAKNNPKYGKEDDIETIFVTYETLRDLEHLVIYDRDMNGLVSNDKQASLLLKQCGQKNGMDLGYGSVYCGSTDAGAFSQAGLKAVAIAGMSPNLQDYYHTRKDNWDNLNPECLAKVLDITIDMINQFDKEGLPTLDNTK